MADNLRPCGAKPGDCSGVCDRCGNNPELIPRLKPCLRCGSDNVEIVEYGGYDGFVYRVKCSNNHAWDEWHSTLEKAVEAWNERPLSPLIPLNSCTVGKVR